MKTTVLQTLLVVAVFGFIGYIGVYLPLFGKYKEPREFDGIVLEKWINVRETEQGSHNTRRILVKTADGRKFNIIVDADVYEQSKDGSRIKRDADGGFQINR